MEMPEPNKTIDQALRTILGDVRRIRQELHRHPELSMQEKRTARRITDFLSELPGTMEIRSVGGTGVCARLTSGLAGPTVLIRGDIDALPVPEDESLPYHSEVEGVSHKCGHDGHTAILLGLAALLAENPVPAGEALLLFQPSEENGRGAKAVLEDPFFSGRDIDYVFALHNLPGYEKNEIVVRSGSFTATVLTVIVRLSGKTSHAAEPENGISPSAAIAELLQYASAKSINEPERSDFTLFTPVYAVMGEKAYGTAAGYGEVHLTVRTWTAPLMESRLKDLGEFLRNLADNYQLTVTEERTERFYSNKNREEAVTIVKKAADAIGLPCTEIGQPFKWGEDFGLFTQRYPGAMFGLGAGRDLPGLHHPDYDFPDDIIAAGILMFYTILNEITGGLNQ